MLTFGNEHRSDTILFIANETGTDSMRWYEGIKIFYILSGTAHIHVEKNDHTLTAEDFLVVNAFELHSILLSENSEILEMCIPLAIISRVFGSSDPHAFDCDSSRCRPEQEQYLATIRRIYADLFRAVYKGHQDNTAYIFSEVYALIDLLSRHFPRQHAIHDPLLRKQNARQLQGILSYINENFRSDLSIHAVAQANFITSNYLSRYFHRMVGTTFTDYLTSVRLSSAYGELVSTSKTITRIALDNGFRSTNAFIKYFKNQYGETPGKLRRDLEENPPAPAHPTDDARIFQALLRHVSKDANANAVAPDITRLELSVNTIHRGKPLSQTWKNLINIGYAREGLQADVQEQLRRIQREIGFRYVRFQGLLDDDMLIYAENEHGEPELDFTLVDLLFDFLLSIGLKPYVELGFVPSLLAYPQTRAFRRSSYLCLPVDEEKWFTLVKELIFHLEARYGSDQLQTWYFTLMSIHCAVTDKQQTVVDHAAYYALYRRVYRFLKSRGAGYRVSGPGVYSNAIEEDYLWAFLKNCAADDCLPDQFTLLCFPYDPIHDKDYFRTICAPDLPYPDALSPDEQYVSHLTDTVQRKLRDAGYAIPSLALIEWNSTMWQRDLCNDSCFKSAYLIKNITENMDRIWGMGYWTANEMLEETASSSLDFHGGYGLFTSKGIPKSAYLALCMLGRLGDHLLYAGDSCVVTRRGSEIQVLLHHYCHYDELYRNNYLLDPNAEHCYERFVEKGELHVSLELTGLGTGSRRIRRYRLGREYGSSFDQWLSMGLPPQLNREEVAYLKAAAQPAYHVARMSVQNTLTLSAQLAPHEVQLILISQ